MKYFILLYFEILKSDISCVFLKIDCCYLNFNVVIWFYMCVGVENCRVFVILLLRVVFDVWYSVVVDVRKIKEYFEVGKINIIGWGENFVIMYFVIYSCM